MLCSNGLTCKALRDQVRQEPHKLHKEKPRAALIVTSDPIYKEKTIMLRAAFRNWKVWVSAWICLILIINVLRCFWPMIVPN